MPTPLMPARFALIAMCLAFVVGCVDDSTPAKTADTDAACDGPDGGSCGGGGDGGGGTTVDPVSLGEADYFVTEHVGGCTVEPDGFCSAGCEWYSALLSSRDLDCHYGMRHLFCVPIERERQWGGFCLEHRESGLVFCSGTSDVGRWGRWIPEYPDTFAPFSGSPSADGYCEDAEIPTKEECNAEPEAPCPAGCYRHYSEAYDVEARCDLGYVPTYCYPEAAGESGGAVTCYENVETGVRYVDGSLNGSAHPPPPPYADAPCPLFDPWEVPECEGPDDD